MEINRRALYNSLRMNWVLDPSLEVESWQIEDYRSMSSDTIFEKLEGHGIHFDKYSFHAFADTVDSPEDLTEMLLADSIADIKIQDQIYLLIFELWRRFLPEKPSLSIFCDELDYQIHIYDSEEHLNGEMIQDAIANLQVILDQNTDKGMKAAQAFEYVEAGCANDVESFLYDFIAEQIDHRNISYANELLDGFSPYIHDTKWFDFLRATVIAVNDPEEANALIKKLIKRKGNASDLEFNFEVLSFLVPIGERETFEILVKLSIQNLEVEEDFQNLVAICADFYHRLDLERIEQSLQDILNQRSMFDLTKSFDRSDPKVAELSKIISR